MSSSMDVAALQKRYMEACEKHGVPQHISVQLEFSKVKDQQTGVFKLCLDQLTEADMAPLTEFLPLVENSELVAVDVVHHNAASNGLVLLRILRSIGTKLRSVDLKESSFGRDTLWDLFHKGIQCQMLDLSSSRTRKLDMTGHFPQLHTLMLDNSTYFTNLPEGCFRAMPSLARLSLCETRIANLWTTCAALSKLSSLVELRFQSCRCCEGTGQCTRLVEIGNSDYFWEEGFRFRQPADVWNMDWASMDIADIINLDSERSESSRSDEEDSDDLFSDDDSVMFQQQVHTSSEDSSADSDVELNVSEQDGQLVETMSVEEDPHNQVDSESLKELGFEGSEAGIFRSDQSLKEENSSVTRLMEALDSVRQTTANTILQDEIDEGLTGKDRDRSPGGTSEEISAGILGTANHEAISSNLCMEGASAENSFSKGSLANRNKVENSPREGLQTSLAMPKAPTSSRRGRSYHPSHICREKYYRDFMISRLPGLKVLDNLPVTQAEREKAHSVFEEQFEFLPNNRMEKESLIEVLKRRETGVVNGVPSCRRRVGVITNGKSSVSFSRSLCASKMASCGWPSCVPICKFKKSNLELNRKCRPRQFEYHPTDPSLMVFGTLHGEVVVVNHESDKIVGYVQSMGTSHSILGLCWLNKDPNKLIAGSDNGSLQMYDVNRMRATVTGLGSRNLTGNCGRGLRNPAIYTYADFEQLTSVHVNCSDEYFVASGYSRHVSLYDLCTGKHLQVFQDLHEEHINVVKFAHHSPHLFATSSFDRDVKLWDLRQRIGRPLYSVRSMGGNVMVCFSRDDYYLLSSAVDNEVKQHLAVDGRLHTKFDIAPTSSGQNYTRSYYMNGRDYIITGSCEENVVRICCAQTGRRLRDLALEGHGSKTSIYVQSLRGDPFRDFHFSVLAAYLHPHSKSEILKVNLLASNIYKKSHDMEPQYWLPAGMGA